MYNVQHNYFIDHLIIHIHAYIHLWAHCSSSAFHICYSFSPFAYYCPQSLDLSLLSALSTFSHLRSPHAPLSRYIPELLLRCMHIYSSFLLLCTTVIREHRWSSLVLCCCYCELVHVFITCVKYLSKSNKFHSQPWCFFKHCCCYSTISLTFIENIENFLRLVMFIP